MQTPYDDRSPYRVFITDDFMSGGVAISLGLKHGSGTSIMRVGESGRTQLEEVDPMMTTDPTIRLPEEFGRALLEGLLRFYQGASDMHTVRSDLLHERGRVDKLTDAMIEIARGHGS